MSDASDTNFNSMARGDRVAKPQAIFPKQQNENPLQTGIVFGQQQPTAEQRPCPVRQRL
jgi:hypothetical protein